MATGSAHAAGVRSDKRRRRYRFDVDRISGVFLGLKFNAFRHVLVVYGAPSMGKFAKAENALGDSVIQYVE